jgi:hypothetical protein
MRAWASQIVPQDGALYSVVSTGIAVLMSLAFDVKHFQYVLIRFIGKAKRHYGRSILKYAKIEDGKSRKDSTGITWPANLWYLTL